MAKLLDQIFEFIDAEEEEPSGSDQVERALEKALENTTLDHAGCPWDRPKDGSTQETD
jgi:hypothetical protein